MGQPRGDGLREDITPLGDGDVIPPGDGSTEGAVDVCTAISGIEVSP